MNRPDLSLALARFISVLGHPAILLPTVLALRSRIQPEWGGLSLSDAGVPLVIVLIIVFFSGFQVKRGGWSHVDASAVQERAQLNALLVFLFSLAALASGYLGLAKLLTALLSVISGMLVVNLLLQRWLKVSLHVSFAMIASVLMWPILPLVFAGAVFSLIVAWSRLALSRHTLSEVLVGAALGAVAGGLVLGLLFSPFG